MATLLVGTEDGVFRVSEGDGQPRREQGPDVVAFLARGVEQVYAVSPQGALWERNGGEDWRLVNQRPVEDEVWSFAADPQVPGLLYLGVSPALLYRSEDGGATWTPCDSIRKIPGYEQWTFPPPPHIPHVRSIAPDPSTPGAVFIGVEEGGVYRSADGGQTWDSLNEGLYWDVHTVAATPDGRRLYATTGNGAHRSDDGGRSWRRVMQGLDRTYTVPCAASASKRDVVFAAASDTPPPAWYRRPEGAKAALYRSDDGGEHWMRLESGIPTDLRSMPRSLLADGDAAVFVAAGAQVYASHSNGDAWSVVASDLPPVRAVVNLG